MNDDDADGDDELGELNNVDVDADVDDETWR